MQKIAITALVATAFLTAAGALRAQAPTAEGDPVLLLTGFAPFGPGRPANPSWEGIKELDGRRLAGYRIVCREMNVEWGGPLVQLTQWVDEFRPAAVFSFGQGLADGFAIETVAHNERGQTPDNEGQPPAQARIVASGADEIHASIDAAALAKALSEHKFPVRISTNAGRYLCEEALYSLEYLKGEGRIAGDVMFCHVPPLGATVGDQRVDAAYVQRFVEQLVGVWAETASKGVSVVPPASTVLRQAVEDPREKDVRALIERYFLTWNAKDIERYGQCFMPQAAVQLVDPDGRLTTLPLRAFLESQREAHRAKPDMKETPESVDVRLEGRLARVIVHWKLVVGAETQYGYDHFTLMPVGGQWRIANLIFYETEGEAGR